MSDGGRASKRRTVLSLEQALSLPSATLRFAQLGWRVIRIEATGRGRGLPGDPNRYIGAEVADADRRSYFVAPNVGKEAIALNLKEPQGRALLQRLITALDVDVFCCNTVPVRHAQLGIDYETLSAVKPDLIWVGVSALGPDHPEASGYDPVVQAMCGYMELTGDPDGPPTLMGLPVTDLKAGDEVYANVLLALLERGEGGRGRRIDVSMLQAAASWLVTVLPLVDLGCTDDWITRTGNRNRKFVPTSVYAARDGFVFLAIGSDVQWQRLTALPRFKPLANEARTTNEGRHRERLDLYREMVAVIGRCTVDEAPADLRAATIPSTRIFDIRHVRSMPELANHLTATTVPGGGRVMMQPQAVSLPGNLKELPFAPKYGADTRRVLGEAGFTPKDVDALYADGIVA